MSVTKRVYPDGRTIWRARVWTVPIHGPRRQMEKEFPTRRAADAWEREQRQAAHGKNLDLERLALAESGLWERAEPVLHARLSPKTVDSYRRAWRTRIVPTLGRVKVGALAVGDIERAQATWAAEGAGASSIRQARFALSAVLTVAVRDGLLASNAALSVCRPRGRAERRVGQTMTPTELETLVSAVEAVADGDGPAPRRYALMVDLMGSAGLRYGEAAGLKVGDLNFARGVIEVQRQVTEVPLDSTETVLSAGRWREGNLVWGPPKSGRSRVVPMPRHLVEPLRSHTAGRARGALVFESERGGKVIRGNVLKRKTGWPDLVRSLGFSGFRVHDLRATAATNYLAAGVPVHVVRDILGHHDITVTNLYARPHDDALSRAADALAQYAGHGGGEPGGEHPPGPTSQAARR